ncbi:MAG TPA: SMP-30/gluconolactonase/LRE family protein [Vicinamibacterales bacterium]|nr:SMP-30/gluconolactonase/LRE family protein [Vicinamibacterales bacterium]
MTPELALDARAELGEGPLWDDRRQRLLFVDIMRGHVHEFDPATGRDRVIEIGRPAGAVALAESGAWIVAAQGGFWRVDPDTGWTEQIAAAEADRDDTRMNDGAVDPRGRFWAGTMSLRHQADQGTLYRLDSDRTVHAMLSPVTTSNGIAWTADGTRMYYVDTRTGRIDLFDFDADAGTIRNRRAFVTVPASVGKPDGLILDRDDGVWLTLWQGGAVHRYTPDGTLDLTIRFPVTLTTKCAFGGPHLDELFVTSAWIDLNAAERAEQPQAGGVFKVKTGHVGRAASRYQDQDQGHT